MSRVSHVLRSSCLQERLNHFKWTSIFSKKNKARTIANFKNLVKIQPVTSNHPSWTREAAVLVPICRDVSGTPAILVSLRSLTLYKHPGELCFPGGMIDEEDNGSSFRAALRETQEELGIPGKLVKAWGRLPEFFDGTTKVTPIVGVVGGGRKIIFSQLPIYKNEVEDVATIPLQHFCNPDNWRCKGGSISWNNLSIRHQAGKEAVELWGLTAAIAHLTLSALIPPNIYRRKAGLRFSF